jgi:uncharacterized membrane protein YgdD (TMEM256/DUF423 family)
VFLSFYFSFLSLQAVDEEIKKQLVVVAASSIITGAVLFAGFLVYIGMRKIFGKVETHIEEVEKPLEGD